MNPLKNYSSLREVPVVEYRVQVTKFVRVNIFQMRIVFLFVESPSVSSVKQRKSPVINNRTGQITNENSNVIFVEDEYSKFSNGSSSHPMTKTESPVDSDYDYSYNRTGARLETCL